MVIYTIFVYFLAAVELHITGELYWVTAQLVAVVNLGQGIVVLCDEFIFDELLQTGRFFFRNFNRRQVVVLVLFEY